MVSLPFFADEVLNVARRAYRVTEMAPTGPNCPSSPM